MPGVTSISVNVGGGLDMQVPCWGQGFVAVLALSTDMLPHTPGVCSGKSTAQDTFACRNTRTQKFLFQ